MTKQEAQELLNRYDAGTCTPEEKALVDRWYEREALAQDFSGAETDFFKAKSEIWDAIHHPGSPHNSGLRKTGLATRILAAATLLLILSASVWLYKEKKSDQLVNSIKKEVKYTEIRPGSDKAVLTLQDGSKILLDDRKQGVIATQSGIKISKLSNGTITYDASATYEPGANSIAYNTIETPKGGKYQIVLPDGSKVWLNAESSLRFSAAFASNERVVELTGEAFFDVAKNKSIPFKVKTRDMNIFVTGTKFNVMAYKDESVSTATLIEGSVQVSDPRQKVTLNPGQQVVYKPGIDLSKKAVDVEEAIAWKNGLFQFNNADIQTVMRQIGRWYDVSVEYKGNIPAKNFEGYISRDSKLSQVLKMLELSGLRFAMEERKIIILP